MSLMERTSIRHHVGVLLLIQPIAEHIGLRALLGGAMQPHGNDQAQAKLSIGSIVSTPA